MAKLIWFSVAVGSYQMLSQDLLISVCTIIEGAPRVDAKGLSCPVPLTRSPDANTLTLYLQSFIPFATFYPIFTTLSLQPLNDSLMSTPSCVPFIPPSLIYLFIWAILRLSDHSDDHLNIKSMPFSFPSRARIKLIGIHLTHFPHNGSLPTSPLPPFQYTDFTPFAAYHL